MGVIHSVSHSKLQLTQTFPPNTIVVNTFLMLKLVEAHKITKMTFTC